MRPLTPIALLVLCVAPVVAALTGLLEDPAALGRVLGSPRVLRLLGGTVALGAATALASLLVGVPVAWWLARRRGLLVTLGRALLVVPLVLPPWMVGVAWTRWLPLSGMAGSVVLLTLCLWPLVALFALRGFVAVGRASAAARLARGPVAAFVSIDLPAAAPSITSGALLVFVFAVTDFSIVDLLSFYDPEPFVVLASEIYQKWARLDDASRAAATSLVAMAPSVAALGGLLALERRHAGRRRGPQRPAPRARLGMVSGAGLLAALALALLPIGVMLPWAAGASEPGAILAEARESMLVSAGVGLGVGALVALLGLALARRSLERGGAWLLALCLLPLAAPGVMLGIGEVRLWNHPANPLADALYASRWLLVLGIGARYLPLGVLAARALLVRMDPLPLRAGRLAGRPPPRRVLRIDLPLLAPALGLGATLGYLMAMRELDLIAIVPAGTATLGHRIYSMVHIASDEVTALLCMALVGLALVPAVAARLLGVPGVDGGTSASRR